MNPKLCAGYFAVVLALALGVANPAFGADGVSRISGPNTGGPAYVSPDLGGGCTIGIEIVRSLSSPPQVTFFRKAPECDEKEPGKTQVVATTRDLLAAAAEDGQNLSLIATVDPTAVLQPSWVQNYIDCAIGDGDSPALTAAAGRLERCDVVPELREAFAAQGVAIHFARGSEPFGFECDVLDSYRTYFDLAWLAKYQGRHCRLNVPTHWWFSAAPL